MDADEAVATLGPEALPAPPRELAALLDQPRHLHPLLRDQRTIAGIGRSWVDEILWTARLSPFKKGSELEPDEVERLRAMRSASTLQGALDHYEQVIGDTMPDKLPMPLEVHRRAGRAVPALRHHASRRSTSRTTSCVTAPRSRPGAACSRTAGCRGC